MFLGLLLTTFLHSFSLTLSFTRFQKKKRQLATYAAPLFLHRRIVPSTLTVVSFVNLSLSLSHSFVRIPDEKEVLQTHNTYRDRRGQHKRGKRTNHDKVPRRVDYSLLVVGFPPRVIIIPYTTLLCVVRVCVFFVSSFSSYFTRLVSSPRSRYVPGTVPPTGRCGTTIRDLKTRTCS